MRSFKGLVNTDFQPWERLEGGIDIPELMKTSVLTWKREQPFDLAVTKFIEYAKCFLGIVNHKN